MDNFFNIYSSLFKNACFRLGSISKVPYGVVKLYKKKICKSKITIANLLRREEEINWLKLGFLQDNCISLASVVCFYFFSS